MATGGFVTDPAFSVVDGESSRQPLSANDEATAALNRVFFYIVRTFT